MRGRGEYTPEEIAKQVIKEEREKEAEKEKKKVEFFGKEIREDQLPFIEALAINYLKAELQKENPGKNVEVLLSALNSEERKRRIERYQRDIVEDVIFVDKEGLIRGIDCSGWEDRIIDIDARVRPSLTQLPELPKSLKELRCGNNLLTQLPELPESLETLSCHNNRFTRLPELPKDLKELYCSDNLLTQLPELPESLETLSCENNRLTRLPELPKGLKYLSCENNLLTRLPELPEDLTALYCNDNRLTELPKLPKYLEGFTWRNNPLSRKAREAISEYYERVYGE